MSAYLKLVPPPLCYVDERSTGMKPGGLERGCSARKNRNQESRGTGRVEAAWGVCRKESEDLKTVSLGG